MLFKTDYFWTILNMKESRLSCKDVIFSVFNNSKKKQSTLHKNLHSPLNSVLLLMLGNFLLAHFLKMVVLSQEWMLETWYKRLSQFSLCSTLTSAGGITPPKMINNNTFDPKIYCFWLRQQVSSVCSYQRAIYQTDD